MWPWAAPDAVSTRSQGAASRRRLAQAVGTRQQHSTTRPCLCHTVAGRHPRAPLQDVGHILECGTSERRGPHRVRRRSATQLRGGSESD
eukprot:scaffold897_cov402-Prasinococcus_capsulatus_cf.AAC.18